MSELPDGYFVHAKLDGSKSEYYGGFPSKEAAFKHAILLRKSGWTILSIKLRCFTDITNEFNSL